MKLLINGQEVIGEVDQLVELIKALKPTRKQIAIQSAGMPVSAGAGTATELQAAVAQSQELRKKLESDPNHTPFGGVIPGEQETQTTQSQPRRAYNAETDTGVSFDT